MILAALLSAGCLDLSTEGKVFAGAGGGAGGAGGSGGTGGTGGGSGGGAGCECVAPVAQCRGTVRISYASPTCRDDGSCQFQAIETQCPGACTDGVCDGASCFGVSCDLPPKAACLDATTLRGYTATGTCTGGSCTYASVDVSCTCAGDHCLSNPCAGVNCTTPPAPTCVGGLLRTWTSPGVCDGNSGQCVYVPSDVACPNGCAAGQCTGDKCAGVSCNSAPTAYCSSVSSLKSFSAPGSCNAATGACSYTATDVTCPSGVCSNGVCQPPTVCTPETDAQLCARVGRVCGPYSGVDNCGAARTVSSCGSCTGGGTCLSSGTCQACQSETDVAFCARQGKNCGTVSGSDNCGAARTVTSCGSCTGGQTCSASNVCGCTPETNTAFCSRLGKNCGSVTGTDNCGTARTVSSCGTCSGGQSCSASNVCACTPETNTAFCSRLGKTCGTVTANDNCGTPRTVTSCGTCTGSQSCNASNVCACVPETDAAWCARWSLTCGGWNGTDNCGQPRSVSSCGTCTGGQQCNSSGACITPPAKMYFTSSWQTLPNTGSNTFEYRCVGTVSLNGTRCSASTDPVEVRINGSVYVLYPGCDSNRNNCVTTVPSGASYSDDGYAAGGRLLCDAMGWSLSSSISDKNAGTVDRAVAVIETNPVIYGTDSAQKNYSTYVECR